MAETMRIQSEDTAASVRVVGPGGERSERCLFRALGLAVWRHEMSPDQAAEGAKVGWDTGEVFSITHEASGLRVGGVESFGKAQAAITILTQSLGLDWRQPMESVAQQLRNKPIAMLAIRAIRAGRLVELTPEQAADLKTPESA